MLKQPMDWLLKKGFVSLNAIILRTIILPVFLFVYPNFSNGQLLKKTTDWIIHHALIDTTTPGQPSFRFYPTVAYAPETNLEIGFITVYLYQAKKDTNNRISELNAFTFYTLQKQYGLWLDNAIYGDRDKWFVLGRTRFQRFPLLYFGIGPNSSAEYPATVDANYLLFRQRVLRKVVPNLFVGPEVDYQSLFNTAVIHEKNDPIKEIPAGSAGTSNLGVGGAIVYDNRHNVLNVRKGLFAELGLLHYSKSLGSTNQITGTNIDVRSYTPVNKRNVLAVQLIGNFLTGDVPFNQMALMGGESMMRGYYTGRYRDKTMVAGQAEYRLLPFSFSKRIGATLFASGAMVASSPGALSTNDLKVTAGAGLRYLAFSKKDIYMRLDVGVTKEGINFYLFTGEAF